MQVYFLSFVERYMLLERLLESDLKAWSVAKNRKPLLLRGARQVGKSSLVEFFANKYFDDLLLINFELDAVYKTCFSDLDPTKICQAITVISQKDIVPGKTLLFLDEIQDCPEAIQSLRYS